MMAVADGPTPFGARLRRARLDAGLTQEALAERAALSARAVSDLERGRNRAPRPDTLRLLTAALGLAAGERAALARAAQAVAARQPGPAVRHNLPLQLTSFVGRECELAAVRERVLQADVRLLALTGPGGVGKTRLAHQAAATLVGDFPDGVWLVELAPLADPDRVPAAVAEGLGLALSPSRPPTAQLVDWLRPRRLLLVLDNCEHLLDACATLAAGLLRVCPGLRLLATSREALGLAGETTWPVPPLALPDAQRRPPAAALTRVAAVALFLDRARAVRSDFRLAEHNAPAVAQICRRLDGLPLAIELAAARVRALPVEDLLARLEDRFRLLTGGSRAALARHQTLRAAVDWSYDLLTGPERALFGRLSVFAGGFALEAAEQVGAGEGLDAADVPDLLARLVDKSLVLLGAPPDGAARYRLLETLRQYSQERLVASGACEPARDRHAAHYLALAERAALAPTSAPARRGRERVAWLDRLEREHDDLRAALRWLLGRRDGAAALRLAGVLGRLWHVRGPVAEGRVWLDAVLALPAAAPPAAPVALRAAVLHEAGRLAADQGDWAAAAAHHTEALALRRRGGPAAGLDQAWSLTALADAVSRLGEFGRARALLAEGVERFRAAGHGQGEGVALMALGTVVRRQAGPAAARPLYAASAARLRASPDRAGLAQALDHLARVARAAGDLPRAFALQREALELRRALGHRTELGSSLGELGTLAGRAGDHARAARLLAAAGVLRRALGVHPGTLSPDDRAAYGGARAAARAHLGGAAFAAAWAAGEALSVDAAVAQAFDAAIPARPFVGAPTNGRANGRPRSHAGDPPHVTRAGRGAPRRSGGQRPRGGALAGDKRAHGREPRPAHAGEAGGALAGAGRRASHGTGTRRRVPADPADRTRRDHRRAPREAGGARRERDRPA